jgi:hypothetical protein
VHGPARRGVLARSTTGFFLVKALVTAVTFGLGAGGRKMPSVTKRRRSDDRRAAWKTADDVRDQFLSIPYESIERFEKAWPCYVKIVLARPAKG